MMFKRTLLQSKVPWLIERQSSLMSRRESLWMRKSTSGCVNVQIFDNPQRFIHKFQQSLGCTLYALAYSHSPFENIQTTEQGGSIAMAVLNAQYKQPSSGYSQGLRDLIDSMLKTNPSDRPDIHEVRYSLELT